MLTGKTIKTVRQLFLERFWSKASVGGEGCWEWQAARRGGYGIYNGRSAHAVAWEYSRRSRVPQGMYVCHRCDNPPCVNPDHLFLGTPKDNVQDCIRKGRAAGPSKVTKSVVRKIRKRLKAGESKTSIAADLGIHRTAITHALKRQ